MSESIIREKAKEFAKNIVFLTKEIKINKKRECIIQSITTFRNKYRRKYPRSAIRTRNGRLYFKVRNSIKRMF